MKHFFVLIALFNCSLFFSQNPVAKDTTKRKSLLIDHSKDKPKAKYNQYRIVTLQNDTTYVDTSLTIKNYYKFNYLRKDIFGLAPFANEGQTYNTLDFGLTNFSTLPEMGFQAKHFNFLNAKQINYYSVATPLTDLYYKSVMEQGQTIEALITMNISERLNYSISFKGLRSLGKYINQLSSTGNFAFTSNYRTKKGQYGLNLHYTGQDILNNENGGIINLSDFESGDPNFKTRARMNVFQKDAFSFLKGKRLFLDHFYRINSEKVSNNLYVLHQINYENKLFEYSQTTLNSTIDAATSYSQFGGSYVLSDIKDQTRYNKLYNKFGVQYENVSLGKFQLFSEYFRDNFYYQKVMILNSGVVPSVVSHKINTIGGQYDYNKGNWNATFSASKAISKQTLSEVSALFNYKLDSVHSIRFELKNNSKVPNSNYTLYQSNFINYNWYNNFSNEKISTFKISADTKWLSGSLTYTNLKDYLYFSNDSLVKIISTPKQYGAAINYLSFKLNKEINYRKWALDNTFLFQEVKQADKILNVPSFVLRNTLYFSDYYFSRALFLQTGVTLNYFTKYYGNAYNPVIGEFYVQTQQKIGDYPSLDFFINGRIRQTRIFLIAEHFNSNFSKFNFYAAPNYPYVDFLLRFGIAWNFFQ